MATATKKRKGKEAQDDTKKWRSLGIEEFDLAETDPIFAVLEQGEITTVGDVADTIAKVIEEDRTFGDLSPDDHNRLVDLINMAAELDEDFDDLPFVEIEGEVDDDDDSDDDTDLDDSPEVEAIDPTTPEGLIAYDELSRQLITKAEEDAAEAESVFEHRHSLASAAKKVFEASVDELRKLIRDRKEGRNKKPAPNLFAKKHKEPDDATNTAEPTSEAWKAYPITHDRWGRWGLTAKDVEILNAGETKSYGVHPIAVLGDMSKYTEPTATGFTRLITDFKRFGEAAAERWTKAEEQFWAWWKGGGDKEFTGEGKTNEQSNTKAVGE